MNNEFGKTWKELSPNLRDNRNEHTKNNKINRQTKNIGRAEKKNSPLTFAWKA
jgi:hypothetical protein